MFGRRGFFVVVWLGLTVTAFVKRDFGVVVSAPLFLWVVGLWRCGFIVVRVFAALMDSARKSNLY